MMNCANKFFNRAGRHPAGAIIARPSSPSSFMGDMKGDSMATKRKGLSKKVRFELFKRDNFQCQYCGRGAPEVILEPDHINPVSNGGDNDLMNLVTSCFDCNRGKSANLISDNSVIQKQRKQLEELNERRLQLEMMLKWRESLKVMVDEQIDLVCVAWNKACLGHSSLNDNGRIGAKKLIEKYGLSSVLDAIDTARESYIRHIDWQSDDANTSAGDAWHKVGGICRVKSKPEGEQRLYYIRGILRNRVYVNERYVMSHLRSAYNAGCDIDEIENLAKTCRNWSQFLDSLFILIDEQE